MALALRGSSRDSFAAARKSLDSRLSGGSANDAAQISSQLFAVAVALDSSLSLRRALTDPSRDAKDKSALAQSLFGSKLSAQASAIVESLVASKWSNPRDLADVAEWLAVSAQAFAAEQEHNLDRLEEELFRFSRIMNANPELRSFLSPSSNSSSEGKAGVVQALLSGKATAQTSALIEHLVAHPRGRNIEAGLTEFAEAASDRRNQVIAYVRSAQALTGMQLDKLTKSLSAQVGRNVRVNVEVDSAVLGGVSIRFADELIDGSLASRLAQAGRELAV
ncbi:MAG: F0F1 ATP synthase subunit delta [Actinomycetota bacterium]